MNCEIWNIRGIHKKQQSQIRYIHSLGNEEKKRKQRKQSKHKRICTFLPRRGKRYQYLYTGSSLDILYRSASITPSARFGWKNIVRNFIQKRCVQYSVDMNDIEMSSATICHSKHTWRKNIRSKFLWSKIILLVANYCLPHEKLEDWVFHNIFYFLIQQRQNWDKTIIRVKVSYFE